MDCVEIVGFDRMSSVTAESYVNAEILSEVISLAEAWNFNLNKLYEDTLKTWLKCIFDKYMKRILSKDYPSSFRMRLAAKDLFYATASGYYKDMHSTNNISMHPA